MNEFLDTFVTVQRPAFLELHVAEVINKIKKNLVCASFLIIKMELL